MVENHPTSSQSGVFEFNEADYARIMLKDSLFDEVENTDLVDNDKINQLYKLQERELRDYLSAVTLRIRIRIRIRNLLLPCI